MHIKKILLIATSFLFACSSHQYHQTGTPAQLDQMKVLAGHWESAKDKSGKREAVNYKVTAGGTAIEETFSPGTPHEMVSMYREVGNNLKMTHYCMLGNQPELVGRKVADNQILFTFSPTPNIDPSKDPHMHEMKLTFLDKNHIREEWTGANVKDCDSPKVFDLTRKK